MPYDIRKVAGKWHVFNQQTGEDKGASDSRQKAEAHMRAMYAAESKPSMSPGMLGGGKTYVDDTYTRRPITHAYMNGKKYAAGGIVGGATDSIPQRDPDMNSAGETTGGKVGLPATGSGATEPGLGAGIIAAVTGKVSNTNDKQRSKAKDERGPDPNDVGHFRKGGVLSRLAKKIKKGGLHESLGIPQGQKIPEARIAAAAKKKGKVGEQARLAETFAANRPG